MDDAELVNQLCAASEVAKRLRRDLRLPGGERLGADISRTAAP